MSWLYWVGIRITVLRKDVLDDTEEDGSVSY